jgi:hypothetical protein
MWGGSSSYGGGPRSGGGMVLGRQFQSWAAPPGHRPPHIVASDVYGRRCIELARDQRFVRRPARWCGATSEMHPAFRRNPERTPNRVDASDQVVLDDERAGLAAQCDVLISGPASLKSTGTAINLSIHSRQVYASNATERSPSRVDRRAHPTPETSRTGASPAPRLVRNEPSMRGDDVSHIH